MNLKRLVLWLAGALLVALAYQYYAWTGVAALTGGLIFWLLLHFTRMMAVLRRAAGAPIGYVGSAVMLHAKLQKNMSLLHVLALTRSVGLLLTQQDAQPEIYRWQDAGDSHVTCTFVAGKLQSWTLHRPPADDNGDAIAMQ